jgi:hypothetical protein
MTQPPPWKYTSTGCGQVPCTGSYSRSGTTASGPAACRSRTAPTAGGSGWVMVRRSR